MNSRLRKGRTRVPRRSFLQDGLVKLCIGKQTLQSGVLLLEILQTLRLIDLHAAVLFPPPIGRHLGHTQPPDGLTDADGLSQQDLTASRNFEMISSGLYRFAPIALLLETRYS